MQESIGSRIRAKRKQQLLTQEKFAERLDVSTQFIYQIEHDVRMPSVANLIKLSEILKVSIDFLLKGREISRDDEHIPYISIEVNGERKIYYATKTSLGKKKKLY